MGRMFLGGVRAALESEENVSAETPIVDESETLAAAQNDVAETGEEVSAITETLEDAAELGDDLQVYEEKAEAAGENGGMSPETADVLQTAVESAFSRFFGDNGKHAWPALESFGATGTRLTATSNALEGIRSKIGEVWNALIAFLKKIASKIVEYFNNIFGAAEKLKRRATDVVSRGDVTGKAEKEINNPGLFAKVQVGGNVNLKSAVDALVGASSGAIAVSEEILKDAEALKGKYSKPVENLKSFKASKGEVKGVWKAVSDDRYGTAGDGMIWVASVELMGGEAFVMRRPAKDEVGLEALKVMARMQFKVEKANPKGAAPAAKKLPVLSASDIRSIAAEVGKIADAAVAFRKTSKELETVLADISKEAESAAAEAVKKQETKGEDKEAFNALRSALGKYTSFLIASNTQPVRFAVQKGGDALTYCEASIKAYK